jgi:Fe-S cluster biogenesis protein NfuA
MRLEEQELMAQAARIERLVEEVESFPDPVLRARVTEIMQGVLALYGEGLARMLAIVGQRDSAAEGAPILAAFAEDALISHLLLLHDLHPIDVETRVARALEEVRPYLQSHGGNVEFLGVEGGVAWLRLQGSCQGCPSSTMTLKLAIEEAIQKAAPELIGVEAEGVAAPQPKPIAFIPASALLEPDRQKAAPVASIVLEGGAPKC